MSRNKGTARTSQLITTYGVGSLIALQDESFVVAGTDYWPNRPEDELHEARLERLLGVFGFRRPPSSENSEDIPVARFPTVHWCPSCERLADWPKFGASYGDKSVCHLCPDKSDLIPSRFVVACENGHLDDFPYFRWVHADARHPESDGTAKLSIGTTGATSGLKDIVIRCSCGMSRSMEGAFGKAALSKMGPCSGRRPWLDTNDDECQGDRRVAQRGASNVWFSVTQSAMSIPPWSERAFRILDRNWTVIRAIPAPALEATIENLGLADEEFSSAELAAVARQRLDTPADRATERSLRQEEHDALGRNRPETNRDQEFVCVPAVDAQASLSTWVDKVQQVRRLRLVRALLGFTRLQPFTGDSDRVVPVSENPLDWLPATEITGEGVFLEIDGPFLRDWEVRESVRARVSALDQRDIARFGADGPPANRREISPRLVLIHSLAHALIDQWALESGYPAASLNERLYVDDEMAGLLIYTATSDSAGSLGGVVAMTEDGRLRRSLVEALERAAWCGQDPLCIESTAQGRDGLNLAACHCCALLPETSCEEMNCYLDRALLVGTPADSTLGFFAGLLD